MQPLEHIRAIAERVAASRGLTIWQIQSRRELSGHVVRVFIDRPGPAATPEESVSIEDCEQVNREMSTILDVEDPLPFAYTLEVSSDLLTWASPAEIVTLSETPTQLVLRDNTPIQNGTVRFIRLRVSTQ